MGDGVTWLHLKQTGSLKADMREFQVALSLLLKMDDYPKVIAFMAGLKS